MRETIKRVFLSVMLFNTFLFLGSPYISLVHANETTEEEKEAAAKEQNENGNINEIGDPPSGPDVNRETEEEKINIDTPASVTGQKVDGTGTVVDFSTSGSKAFYTIKDAEQKVYYLIIDLDKTDNNVYFLSDINKAELSGVAEESTHVQPPKEQVQSAQVEAPKEEEESGNGFLIAVLLIAVVGVAAYYFLVMKKRQGQNNEEDEEELEMSEDYEDDFHNDEQVNKDNQ